MTYHPREHLRSIGLYIRGFRWLWTRREDGPLRCTRPLENGIRYKPGGWGPWKFLPVYLTTYLLGVVAGFGVVSISRAATDKPIGRVIDWFFERVLRQGPNHCANTGPALWGSRSAWE